MVQWAKAETHTTPTCGAAMQPTELCRGNLLRRSDTGEFATVRDWSLPCEHAHVLEKLHSEKTKEPLEPARLRPRGASTLVRTGDRSEMAHVESHLPSRTENFDLAPQSANFNNQRSHGVLVCLTHVHQANTNVANTEWARSSFCSQSHTDINCTKHSGFSAHSHQDRHKL